MMTLHEEFKKFKKLLPNSKTFLLATHIAPDGDAIASTLALGLALQSLGKKVVYYNEHGVPSYLTFLPGSERFKKEISQKEEFDVLVLLDCAGINRAGKKIVDFNSYKTLVNIDHHKTNLMFGDINMIDRKASSSGVIVYDILKAFGIKITSQMASNLYSSIMSDTGRFTQSNTSRRDFIICSELLTKGINQYDISRSLYESKSIASLKLLERALKTLDVKDRVATIYLTKNDFKLCQAKLEDAEDVINVPRMLKSVDLVILFKELKKNVFKISLRNKTNFVDVSKIANVFGGGGHKASAGCVVDGSILVVKKKMLRVVKQWM